MKAYVILTLVFAVAGLHAHTVHLTEEQREKVNKYVAECVKETGAKPEVIAEAKKGHYPDDEGLKEFVSCFFKKSGIVGPDYKLNVDVALSKLPPGVDKTEAGKVLEECKTKTGKTPVDTVFEIFKCYHHGTKTHVLF